MKKILLIDTNIISHALTPTQKVAYYDIFKKLEESYVFVITGFTKYELMRSSASEYRQKIELFINSHMSLSDLTDKLILFAARLYYMYSKYTHTKGKRISDGDISRNDKETVDVAYILQPDVLQIKQAFEQHLV